MAAFLRSVLKKPHVKPLLWNCTTYGLLYGGAEFTQQSKAKYYDVSLCLFFLFSYYYFSCWTYAEIPHWYLY